MNFETISDFLSGLVRLSIEGGIMIVLIISAQWIFRNRLSPRWRSALWLLLIARLLLTFSFSSATSNFNLLPQTPHPAQPVATPVTKAEPQVTAILPEALSMTPYSPMPDPSPAAPPVEQPKKLWPVWLFAAWLAGTMLLAGHLIISSVRLWKRCQKLPPLTQLGAAKILDECCQRLDVRNKPQLLETLEFKSPVLHGMFRTRLLLPRGFTSQFSEAELRFVVLHELAHVKRHDLLMNWMFTALQVIHWFNPLVWFGFSRWRADREIACDAMALEAAGDDKNQEYGQTILRLLENLGRSESAPGLVGILEDKRQLRRRIRMIARHVPSRGWPLLALLLTLGLATIGLTDAQNKSIAQENAPTNSSIASDLIGTWVLVGTPDKIGKIPSEGGRLKLFTGKCFSMTQSDPKTGIVMHHHGGTYTVNGDEYSETIEYANPSTINFVGGTNGHFHIKLESDTLTLIGIDNPWKEVWKRVSNPRTPPSQTAKDMVGAWVLVGKPGEVGKVPAKGKGYKLITATDWCDTQADPKTGVVMIHHGGTWALKGDDYVESVKYANPASINLVGHTFKFSATVEGDTLTLKGIENPWSEVWKRVK
jgi:beta-lactamase regulating signal transducer with metallopeptidase domain